MPIFTPKERRVHYTGVANGTKPVKADSKYSEAEQRSYARGQRDALNDQSMCYLLGKNSPLSDFEKQQLRDKRNSDRETFKQSRAKSAGKVAKARK